jgi:hypothetical protein
LEENAEVLLDDIIKAKLSNDLLFLLSRTVNNYYGTASTSLFVYNLQGKLLSKISNQGKGPEEYTSLTDFEIKGDEIYIMDSDSKKILVFDIDNNYLRSIDIPGRPFEFVFKDNSLVYAYLLPDTYLDSKVVIVDSSVDTVKRKYLPWDIGKEVKIPGIGLSLSTNEQNVYYWESIIDTVYLISENELVPTIAINYLNYPQESRYPDKISSISSLLDNSITQDIRVGNRYIYLFSIRSLNSEIVNKFYLINLESLEILQSSYRSDDYAFVDYSTQDSLVGKFISFHSRDKILMQMKKLSDFGNSTIITTHNTDGIFNRFVTVFANRARHVSGELSLGRETEAI